VQRRQNTPQRSGFDLFEPLLTPRMWWHRESREGVSNKWRSHSRNRLHTLIRHPRHRDMRLHDRSVTPHGPRPSQLAYGPTDFRRASSHLPGEEADLRRNAGAASRRPHRCWRRCFTPRAAAAPHGGLDRHALGWWFGRIPVGGASPTRVDRRDVDASGRVKG
jgi:hypothetical protein